MVEQPAGTHLAQINVGTAVDDLDSPRLAKFMGALDRVNAVAERSPGFVWRLMSASGNATDIKVSDDPRFIVNMSVWTSAEHLENFVWKTVHRALYRQRGDWFAAPGETHFAMWWIPAGHVPSLEEGMARLRALRSNGPSEEVFGWESLPHIRQWRTQRCG